jgi:hypothetical protein
MLITITITMIIIIRQIKAITTIINIRQATIPPEAKPETHQEEDRLILTLDQAPVIQVAKHEDI